MESFSKTEAIDILEDESDYIGRFVNQLVATCFNGFIDCAAKSIMSKTLCESQLCLQLDLQFLRRSTGRGRWSAVGGGRGWTDLPGVLLMFVWTGTFEKKEQLANVNVNKIGTIPWSETRVQWEVRVHMHSSLL